MTTTATFTPTEADCTELAKAIRQQVSGHNWPHFYARAADLLDRAAANAAAAREMYEALRRIAWEPIGPPEATGGEIMERMTEIARAALVGLDGVA